MKCIKCNEEIIEGSKFCRNCGTKIEDFCSNCGKRINKNDKFCSNCGCDLIKESILSNEMEQNNKVDNEVKNFQLEQFLEQNNKINKKTPVVVSGCLKGILLTCMNVVISIIIAFATSYESKNVGSGILCGFVSFIIILIVTFSIVNKTKELKNFDCILPLIIGSISAIIFLPISLLGFSFFSSFTCMAASLLLTITLFMYKAGNISGGWLIIPFLVFFYEILPIELPTDFDNMLCFGGDCTNFICTLIFKKVKNNILVNSDNINISDTSK